MFFRKRPPIYKQQISYQCVSYKGFYLIFRAFFLTWDTCVLYRRVLITDFIMQFTSLSVWLWIFLIAHQFQYADIQWVPGCLKAKRYGRWNQIHWCAQCVLYIHTPYTLLIFCILGFISHIGNFTYFTQGKWRNVRIERFWLFFYQLLHHWMLSCIRILGKVHSLVTSFTFFSSLLIISIIIILIF